MPSVAEMLKQYGFVGQLANSNPELRSILTRAAAKGMSTDEFSRAVQDSHWWKTSADAVKKYGILKATKPGEFKAQRAQLVTRIRMISKEMGVNLSEHGNKGFYRLGYLTDLAQLHGWDEATIRQEIGRRINSRDVHSGRTFGGKAGEIQQQIRSMYYDMGVPYAPATINQAVRNVLTGSSTVQQTQANLQAAAKSRYPSLAAQIDAGQTVRQIADPYIQTQAQLLELPPQKITLQDSLVKKGLSQRDSKGQLGMMPLWQYEQTVKADPRWDKTKNAHDAYATMAHKIGRDWGFTS
jgi:hypothetical protein